MKEGDDLNFSESPINNDDKEMIVEAVTVIKEIYSEAFNQEIQKIEPNHLDEILPILKKGTRWNKKKRQNAILILGIGLGQTMVESLGFEWIIYKDDSGEELSFRHRESNWRAFPLSSVAKRIRAREKDYFSKIYNNFSEWIKEKN